ncbi:MAG TPA: hypothetical protein VKM55_27495, partial [Candidatus Lokiarchaeia archaeon]|nr:hypothetical protein [Candidatus Lokiarchaeia archaeon]
CHHRYRCMKCREKHCTLVALKVSIKGNKKNQGMEALMSESMGRGNNSLSHFNYLNVMNGCPLPLLRRIIRENFISQNL